jgi:hypothetical protein
MPITPPANASRPLSALLRQTLGLLGFTHANAAVSAPALSQFIRHHGVAGLLINDQCSLQAADCREALAHEQRVLTFRALQLGAALSQLFNTLHAHGVEPLALKGPALALQAHGKLAARGGVDLDIFVEETHWPLALAALRKLGYQPASEASLQLPDGTHELVLLHNKGLPKVELHRRLLRHRYPLSCGPHAHTELDLQGTPIRTLTPANALPYLVAHANQHCFRKLIWLLDIHAMLQHPELDAHDAAERFVRSGTCGSLDACLRLLSLLFNTSIPAELEAVRRPCHASLRMTELALDALEQSLSDDQIAGQGALRRAQLDLALHDHWAVRWQVLLDWLSPTAADQQWLKLPSALQFLSPFTRVLRVLIKPDSRPD